MEWLDSIREYFNKVRKWIPSKNYDLFCFKGDDPDLRKISGYKWDDDDWVIVIKTTIIIDDIEMDDLVCVIRDWVEQKFERSIRLTWWCNHSESNKRSMCLGIKKRKR